MKTFKHVAVPMAVALAAVAGENAFAQQEGPEAVKALITPDREATIGVTGIVDDKRRSGKYTGANDQDAFAVLDAQGAYRDDATGTWMRFEGRNLGLDNRDLRFEHERQGDWNYFIDLSQTPYRNPFVINTGLTGIGSTNQAVSGTALRNVDLEMDRYRVTVGGGKKLGEQLGLKVSYRHESKQGERQWGTQGFNFITEPIDFTTQEVQGSVSYSVGKLQLSGGYLGSFFRNNNAAVYSNAGVTEVSLPLDNQAHKLFLSGAYMVSPTTRVNGKLAYSIALQNENFYTAPTFTGNTRNSLDGRVDTLLAQLGGTSRPLPKLTLNARLRYEYRDDKTVQAQYVTEDPERSGINTLTSRTTATGDFSAGYQLPMDFHLTAGVKFEHWDREIPTKRQVSWQAQTNEASYSVGLRRRLTDTLGGSAGFIYSVRNGSGTISDTASSPSNRIDAILWADRERAKWRLALDWTPLNRLSMQMIYEESADEYNNRSLGPRDGSSRHITIDGNYRVNDDWSVNAWATLMDTKIDQATNGDGLNAAGASLSDRDWQADLRHLGKSFGLGTRGRVMDKVKLGGNIQYTEDVSEHKLNGLLGDELRDLPDIRYRQGALNAFVEYALWEHGKVRFNYNFIHTVAKDWTYAGFAYADGTQITIPTQEDTHFIGLSYTHKW